MPVSMERLIWEDAKRFWWFPMEIFVFEGSVVVQSRACFLFNFLDSILRFFPLIFFFFFLRRNKSYIILNHYIVFRTCHKSSVYLRKTGPSTWRGSWTHEAAIIKPLCYLKSWCFTVHALLIIHFLVHYNFSIQVLVVFFLAL
jgi:hypothetical protein